MLLKCFKYSVQFFDHILVDLGTTFAENAVIHESHYFHNFPLWFSMVNSPGCEVRRWEESLSLIQMASELAIEVDPGWVECLVGSSR